MSRLDLPEFYLTEDGARVREPVYRLLADCFLGAPGKPPGLWEAGCEIQHDLVPNEHMQPLNRAAGEAVERWQAALPIVAGRFTEEEIGEAAALMAPKEGEQVLPHALWWAGVLKLAAELKIKKAGMRVPAPTPQHVAPLNRTVPPMTAGEYKDAPHRDQAATGIKAHPQAARRLKPAQQPPAMTTEPRPQASDGVNAG